MPRSSWVVSSSQAFQPKFCRHLIFLHVCFVPCPSHRNIWWRVQIMELRMHQLEPLKHLVLKHPQSVFFPNVIHTFYNHMKWQVKLHFLYILSVCFWILSRKTGSELHGSKCFPNLVFSEWCGNSLNNKYGIEIENDMKYNSEKIPWIKITKPSKNTKVTGVASTAAGLKHEDSYGQYSTHTCTHAHNRQRKQRLKLILEPCTKQFRCSSVEITNSSCSKLQATGVGRIEERGGGSSKLSKCHKAHLDNGWCCNVLITTGPVHVTQYTPLPQTVQWGMCHDISQWNFRCYIMCHVPKNTLKL